LPSPFKRPYSKPFKSYKEQVDLLASRGLVSYNPDEAARFLSYVNYYRFSGYAFIFKEPATEKYRSDVSFEDVVALYRFDRALRTLVAEGIALIEIYARTKIAYFIAEKYGVFGHAKADNFPDKKKFDNWHREIRNDAKVSAKKEKPFESSVTQHFREVYGEWPELPIWTLTEILTFGKLARLFSLLRESDQGKIAREFDLKSGKVLDSWFTALSATRNVCAHFERLWNRTTHIEPSIPNEHEWKFVEEPPRKIFRIFTIIKYGLDVIAEKTSESTDWEERFNAIMNLRPCGTFGTFNDAFYQNQTGFVPDWETRWKELKPSCQISR